MSQAEDNMKRSLEKRGYAVIASLEPKMIGQVISSVNRGDPDNEFQHPFSVIRVTDRADYEAQCALNDDSLYLNPAYQHFYRVVTD